MKIVKIIKVTPMFREQYRGKNWVQMRHPQTNQPLTEHDSITLKELESKNIMIFETRAHNNYKPSKKALFRSQKFYYEEE